MAQTPTNTQRRASAKVPDQWETWHSYNNGLHWTMVDGGYPKDKDDMFPIKHKYGWTERNEGDVIHYRVKNPEVYWEGCLGHIAGYGTKDESYDLEVEIQI